MSNRTTTNRATRAPHNRDPRNRRGQMELLGLAVVVVIVSIGMMYLLVFMVGKPPKLIHAKFAEKEISQNFIGAMLRTQSRDCRGLSIGELLQDCANYAGGSIVCGNGERSCAFAQRQIEEMLLGTAYRWQYNYRFRVFRSSEPQNLLIPKSCTNDAACESGRCVFPQTSGTVSEGSCSSTTLDGVPINPFNPAGLCTDRSDKETPGVQPLPLDVGTLTVMFEICRG